MTKLMKQNFVAQQAGRSIDLEKLENNAEARAQLEEKGVSMDRLRRSDLNGDGKLEASEAFYAADHFDRDGNRASLDASFTDRSGNEVSTQAGRAASVLGLMLQRNDLQAVPSQNDPPATPGGNDDILFVGMGTETRTSAGAKHEIKELRKTGADVTGIMDSKYGDDTIKAGGRLHDLSTDTGRQSFVETLGLPAEQSQKISDALASTDRDGRDEMGQIAQVWARAERGGSIPSRMVISGHHVGSAVWGDGNGRLSWTALGKLAEAMPKAASQLEDLHISACYSGGQSKRDMFKEMFPNVKTVWAYSGSAPGTGSGATVHQASWERATRGDGGVEDAVASLQRRGVRKADNIDAKAISQPTTPTGPSLDSLRAQIDAQENVFEGFFRGTQDVVSTQRGPLREYYNHLQAALQHPDLTGADRTSLEERRDQTIRTLYYDSHIKHRFSETHADAIQSGFSSLGLETPDFAFISRERALGAIEGFRDQLRDNPTPEGQQLLPLLNGLWNLDPHTIPETWI